MRGTQAANGTEGQMIRVNLFLCWRYGMGFAAACNSYAANHYQFFCGTCLTARIVAFMSLTMLTDDPFHPRPITPI
jgi:hypothetical protein